MPYYKDYFCIMPIFLPRLYMEVHMRVGEDVNVMDVHDNTLLRKVVAVEDGFVYVSRPEELEQARREDREPNCIGFPLSAVVTSQNHR